MLCKFNFPPTILTTKQNGQGTFFLFLFPKLEFNPSSPASQVITTPCRELGCFSKSSTNPSIWSRPKWCRQR